MKGLLLAVVLLSAANASPLVGQYDTPGSRPSLVGVPGILVVVEDEGIKEEARRDGLSKDQIQTDVEVTLRQAGVTILSEKDWLSTRGSPFLYVRVQAVKVQSLELYAFSVAVDLNQLVTPVRDSSITPIIATTWSSRSNIGTVGRGNVRLVRDVIRDAVDRFINAYLTANPRR